ncbi:aromatic-ring-hydroxylating dioxygenase subunit beta [Pseudocolwellia sp. HL-MZ19]|uniref:aromatic-ring-hydroxylating dioxygenase subunit beta n=1 Tax=Pseudocolwellia sp. HL-MZ19 TaxID=3400846 RepID=UPI003CF5CB1C
MKLDTQLLADVSAFLNVEADMLDNKEYRQWLDLWVESGLYIVPVDHEATDYANNLNVAYDDHEMRELRIERLTSGEAISTQLSQKTVRTLSRFRILDDIDGVVRVRCAYCLYENNKTGVRTYPANLQFKLVRDGGSFKITEKVVKIMQSSQSLTTVSYLF